MNASIGIKNVAQWNGLGRALAAIGTMHSVDHIVIEEGETITVKVFYTDGIMRPFVVDPSGNFYETEGRMIWNDAAPSAHR